LYNSTPFLPINIFIFNSFLFFSNHRPIKLIMAVTIIISLLEIPLDLINELWVNATQYLEFDLFFPMIRQEFNLRIFQLWVRCFNRLAMNVIAPIFYKWYIYSLTNLTTPYPIRRKYPMIREWKAIMHYIELIRICFWKILFDFCALIWLACPRLFQ
jgi:hypothetical protein